MSEPSKAAIEAAANAIRLLEREHGVEGKDWTGLDSDLVAEVALAAALPVFAAERDEAVGFCARFEPCGNCHRCTD